MARESCLRCRRPADYCWCAALPHIPTQTRVVLLQHPRERDVPIGTARMASLCLPNSELHVGLDWSESQALQRALSDPSRPAALLYPGDDAINVFDAPPPGPITLVVVDGTWSLTKKLVKLNPVLAALPRYAFRPPNPSEYRIRREPTIECVSTLEAIVHVLGALEGDAERFRPMLIPFRKMIDAQIACEKERHTPRSRYQRPGAPPKPVKRAPLEAYAGRMVCVLAEGNVQPARLSGGKPRPHELIQWVACRVSTGETFESVIAPKTPIASGTPVQTELTVEQLNAGTSSEAFVAAWKAFLRDDDVVCVWGDYPAGMIAALDCPLPEPVLDLRSYARAASNGKVGMPGELLTKLGRPALSAPLGQGRAGRRLAEVVTLARWLSEG